MMFLVVVVAICYHSEVIEQDWLWHTANYETSGCTWYIRILLYVAGIIGIVTLLAWTPDKNYKYVGYIGRNTLQIYLFHAQLVLIMEALDCFRAFAPNIFVPLIAPLFLLW